MFWGGLAALSTKQRALTGGPAAWRGSVWGMRPRGRCAADLGPFLTNDTRLPDLGDCERRVSV